ncbi:hypothetical protein [Xanthomonas sacchari]|uniref:hypothetical protein n=1 Tax=Xanthomonas sacchari TaxID=56458 RepID=UPI001F1F35C6|nr:hypothetical protein [Xanthomonas sacchari]MDV0437025.1 hypothetical protein [Xanthomonas sacchari]
MQPLGRQCAAAQSMVVAQLLTEAMHRLRGLRVRQQRKEQALKNRLSRAAGASKPSENWAPSGAVSGYME